MPVLRVVVAALSAFAVLTLAACGSNDTPAAGKPDWTFAGQTGSIDVTAPADSAAPRVSVTAPFGVEQTTVHTLTEGDGQPIADTATVSVDYLGVNGRDGKEFDSSYSRGQAAEFPLTGVIPGFQKAIAGQKVGSTVAVAVAPADGYTQGQPSAGIEAGDTLVFVIVIHSAK